MSCLHLGLPPSLRSGAPFTPHTSQFCFESVPALVCLWCVESPDRLSTFHRKQNLSAELFSTMANIVLFVLLLMYVTVCVGALYSQDDQINKRSRYYNPRNISALKCSQSQTSIDFKEILGLWNVIEVIEHSERYTDRRNYLRTEVKSATCPVVHFSTQNDREVKMLFNDEGGYIQYEFRMTNINNPGFWMSVGWQTGTLLDNSYEHFAGTVQVMKAVQSHMVLTFCSPHQRHFSIILARKNYLSHDEIRGVHKQLNRINLPLVNIQGYCKNGGLLTVSSIASVLLALAVSCRHWLS